MKQGIFVKQDTEATQALPENLLLNQKKSSSVLWFWVFRVRPGTQL